MLLCCCVVAQAPTVTECSKQETPTISWGLEIDCNPRYVWRGLAFSEGPVAQTSTWVTARNFTYTMWANSSLDRADGGKTNEIDHCLSWAGKWGKADLEPALQIYTYPNQENSPSTAEADLTISRPVGRLSLFTRHSVDVHQYRGAYFAQVGLGLTKEVGNRGELESNVSLGWGSSNFNESYVGLRKAALNVASIDACLTYRMRGSTYIRPHLSISRILDSDLRRAVSDPSITVLGIAVGTEF
jgi:hypothetical protein